MMTNSDASTPVQANLFKVLLRDIVYPQHELILLRDAIDWERFEKVLEPVYCQNNGRSSIPVRMMVGLMMLRTMYGLSDQEVLDGWVENPYWQSFCGGTFFEHEPPTDQSIMSRWRSRVGETGVTEMLKESVAAAVRSKVAKRRDFEKVNIDTTVQEKNVRFPTDARTLDRARERVVAVGEKLGIRFKRTYVRKGKTMLRKHSGYVKAKQFNRAENAVRTLKQYLRNVIDFAESQPVVPRNTRELGLIVMLQEYVARSRKLLKLMKGLGRLFLYLRAEAAGFAEFLSAFVRFWLCDAPQLRHPLSSRCGLLKLGFA